MTAPPLAAFEPLAREILRDVLAACEPASLLRPHLAAIPPQRGVRLIAVGKASAALASAAIQALGDRLLAGVCTVPRDGPALVATPRVLTLPADHPLPTADNVRAAQAIARLAVDAAADHQGHLLLVAISGGGSSHLSLPAPGVSLDDLRAVTQALLRSGAPIAQLNCVRKHLEQLKGGRLAVLAWPSPVHAMVLSDVLGDPLDAIASGPCAADPTTFADALRVLDDHGLRELRPAVTAHLLRGTAAQTPETPKPEDPRLLHTQHTVIGNNSLAVAAAAAAAGRLGFRVVHAASDLTGPAHDAGAAMAREAIALRNAGARRAAVIRGGETTVHVRGSGRGGRNQEFALAAAIQLDGTPETAVLSLATDGVDGPTPAAGALVTGDTVPIARTRSLDPAAALAANDSHALLAQAADAGAAVHLRYGPTGTNLNDVAVALVL